MADENKAQPELKFPDPDNFPSYDEVESQYGQAEMPRDSFNAELASDNEGCCVR